MATCTLMMNPPHPHQHPAPDEREVVARIATQIYCTRLSLREPLPLSDIVLEAHELWCAVCAAHT
jgi:hypothetical protein